MTGLIYVSILAAAIFPYTMIQAIKKAIHKEDGIVYTALSCINSAVIFATLFLLHS